jgi:hypothetical protein
LFLSSFSWAVSISRGLNFGSGETGAAWSNRFQPRFARMNQSARYLYILAFLTAIPGGALALEEQFSAEPESSPKPNQHEQALYQSRRPVLFATPDVNQVFEKEAYPEPEFLPESAYAPAIPEDPRIPAEEENESGLQLATYPMEDNGTRDTDPEGHYTEPRWNPFPFLTEQLACLPKDEQGFVWKETSSTTTALPGSASNLGIVTEDVRSVMYFGQLPILQFAPRFGWHLLSGPTSTDLPPQLYDGGLDVSLYLPLSKRWSFLGMVGPSVFTDGRNTSSDAFRMTGRAIGFYQWSDTLKVSVGFLYLGRQDIRALPVGGVIWQPSEDLKAEILFPRPKIARRCYHNGDREGWVYLVGELGGNSWAIERASGLNDIVTYRDYRLIAGFEFVHGKLYRWLVETGYVFGRQVEYVSDIGNTTISPTGLLRVGFTF